MIDYVRKRSRAEVGSPPSVSGNQSQYGLSARDCTLSECELRMKHMGNRRTFKRAKLDNETRKSAHGAFAYSRPIPPASLLVGEIGIFGLCDGRTKDIVHARILSLAGFCLQSLNQLTGILTDQFLHAVDPQKSKVSFNRWSDRKKVTKFPLLCHTSKVVSDCRSVHHISIKVGA